MNSDKPVANTKYNIRQQEGDWCELGEDGVVTFYRKNGEPYMHVPLEDYEIMHKPEKPMIRVNLSMLDETIKRR